MATADRHALNFNPDLQRLLGITDRLVAAGTKLATPVTVQIHGAIVFAWEHDAQLYLKRVYKTSAQMTHRWAAYCDLLE